MLITDNQRLCACTGETLVHAMIPDDITTIGSGAFRDHKSLAFLTLSPSVKTIGEEAFRGCSALAQITFRDGLRRLGDGCFRGCSALTAVHLPDSVVSIHPRAFMNCTSLENVRLSAALRRNIEGQTFAGCTSLTRIVIPQGVARIKTGAFTGCTALETVVFENPDIQIEKNAFSGCTKLHEETRLLIGGHLFDDSAVNISSRAAGPAGRLSNYTPRSFIFDGVPCASLEGVLQSFKCPDAERQAEICMLAGGWAKKAGSAYDWKGDQLLYWKGEAYPRRSEAYQRLLDRLYDAVYAQDAAFRDDLHALAGKKLDHRMGQSNPAETVLTRHEFVFRLMQLAERCADR